MASFTSARSPVSGAMASLGAGEAFDGFALRCAEACLACRFFPDAALRWGRASFATGDFLVASCAFWACGLWLVRAVASVEKRASPASVKKQDSERKHRFIPWSPCETHVTNAVKTKRSHDARGLTCSKDTTTPEVQLSLQGNKRAQNEADGTRSIPSSAAESPATAGRTGPAVLNPRIAMCNVSRIAR